MEQVPVEYKGLRKRMKAVTRFRIAIMVLVCSVIGFLILAQIPADAADAWIGISSTHIVSHCGEESGKTLAEALDGTDVWNHAPDEVHWFELDLGQVYTIKQVRGLSLSNSDPIDVDIYVSLNGTDWGTAVATGISAWQDTTTYVDIDTTDKHGRYIRVVINATEGGISPNYLRWKSTGTLSIFDAYGDTPAWESYDDDVQSNVWGTVPNPYDDTTQTVYMYGEGFLASQLYHVGFYDPSAAPNKVASTDPTSSASGNLSTQYLLSTDPSADPGTWHAVVYQDPDSPPTSYNATDPNIVTDDDFEVVASAIPEFPTVIAGIVVAGLCFGIFYWMRKRRLRHVVFKA